MDQLPAAIHNSPHVPAMACVSKQYTENVCTGLCLTPDREVFTPYLHTIPQIDSDDQRRESPASNPLGRPCQSPLPDASKSSLPPRKRLCARPKPAPACTHASPTEPPPGRFRSRLRKRLCTCGTPDPALEAEAYRMWPSAPCLSPCLSLSTPAAGRPSLARGGPADSAQPATARAHARAHPAPNLASPIQSREHPGTPAQHAPRPAPLPTTSMGCRSARCPAPRSGYPQPPKAAASTAMASLSGGKCSLPPEQTIPSFPVCPAPGLGRPYPPGHRQWQ
jgi:hypothetical protein